MRANARSHVEHLTSFNQQVSESLPVIPRDDGNANGFYEGLLRQINTVVEKATVFKLSMTFGYPGDHLTIDGYVIDVIAIEGNL